MAAVWAEIIEAVLVLMGLLMITVPILGFDQTAFHFVMMYTEKKGKKSFFHLKTDYGKRSQVIVCLQNNKQKQTTIKLY